MDHLAALEQLKREIEPLPHPEQFERLLAFFQRCAQDMHPDDVEILKRVFALKGNDVGTLMAEVLEGEQALRKLR